MEHWRTWEARTLLVLLFAYLFSIDRKNAQVRETKREFSRSHWKEYAERKMALRAAILHHVRVPVKSLSLSALKLQPWSGFIRSMSSHDDHLTKEEVIDRVLAVVKDFPKVDPSKVCHSFPFNRFDYFVGWLLTFWLLRKKKNGEMGIFNVESVDLFKMGCPEVRKLISTYFSSSIVFADTIWAVSAWSRGKLLIEMKKNKILIYWYGCPKMTFWVFKLTMKMERWKSQIFNVMIC